METDTEKQTEKADMTEGVGAEENGGQETELARLKELVAEMGRENERLGRTERAQRQTQEFILKHPRAGEMRRELEEAVLAAEPERAEAEMERRYALMLEQSCKTPEELLKDGEFIKR